MSVKKAMVEQYRRFNHGFFVEKVLIMAIQKETFDAVYDFLESEANDEK